MPIPSVGDCLFQDAADPKALIKRARDLCYEAARFLQDAEHAAPKDSPERKALVEAEKLVDQARKILFAAQ